MAALEQGRQKCLVDPEGKEMSQLGLSPQASEEMKTWLSFMQGDTRLAVPYCMCVGVCAQDMVFIYCRLACVCVCLQPVYGMKTELI